MQLFDHDSYVVIKKVSKLFVNIKRTIFKLRVAVGLWDSGRGVLFRFDWFVRGSIRWLTRVQLWSICPHWLGRVFSQFRRVPIDNCHHLAFVLQCDTGQSIGVAIWLQFLFDRCAESDELQQGHQLGIELFFGLQSGTKRCGQPTEFGLEWRFS